MTIKKGVTTSILVMTVLFAMQVSCYAQAPESVQKLKNQIRYRFSYTPVYQFETDMDNNGQFGVQRHLIRFDVSRSIVPKWTAGLGVSLDYERWQFSNIAGLHSVDIWDEIIRPGISVPIFYTPSQKWRFGLIPSLTYAGATGAETDKALSYGGVISGTYVFTPDLMIGIGAGLFERLDQFEMFPYLVVNWKVNEQFRITNPFTAGPVGPAGLELVYSPLSDIEIGVGGAYRSYRFRLDDSSLVADGIGEVDFWATFFRVGWKLNRTYRFDINGGLLLDGNITIEDSDSEKLGKSAFDTAPFIGMTLQGRF